jgi:hypothetical protein
LQVHDLARARMAAHAVLTLGAVLAVLFSAAASFHP